jgi:hypothetical protein
MPPVAPPAPPRLTAIVPTVGAKGEPVFVVLAKRTYDLLPGAPPALARQPRELTQIDAYHDDGDPETSTAQHEADLLAPFKPATDVVVVGRAYAPGGKPVPQCDVAVEVAGRRKAVRVIGDRTANHRPGREPAFSDPVPFAEMELRYDRAYGGIDERSVPGLMCLYPRNPRGTGFVLRDTPETVNGLRLPNLEDPADLLLPALLAVGEPTRWPEMPLPQGVGWFPKIAYPRCSFVGAMPAFVGIDTKLKEEALGLVPAKQIELSRRFRLPRFDVRFNSGASPGLALPFLAGGEPVKLTNLTPDGAFAFNVPKDRPRMTLDIGKGPVALEVVLQTVCGRAEDWQLDLVWRGALGYPGPDWLPEMKRLAAEVT